MFSNSGDVGFHSSTQPTGLLVRNSRNCYCGGIKKLENLIISNLYKTWHSVNFPNLLLSVGDQALRASRKLEVGRGKKSEISSYLLSIFWMQASP